MITTLESAAVAAFNRAIAEELIKEIDPNAPEDSILRIVDACRGNPWDAGILYAMSQAIKAPR